MVSILMEILKLLWPFLKEIVVKKGTFRRSLKTHRIQWIMLLLFTVMLTNVIYNNKIANSDLEELQNLRLVNMELNNNLKQCLTSKDIQKSQCPAPAVASGTIGQSGANGESAALQQEVLWFQKNCSSLRAVP